MTSNRVMYLVKANFSILFFCIFTANLQAADLMNTKVIMPELALAIAQKSLDDCRKKGYQVSAVVVDRSGHPLAVLRDVYASRFTIKLAEHKANAAVLSGIKSSEFRKAREDIRPEINELDDVLLLEGGIPIRTGGTMVGAVGVAGAPGGELDEACAQTGIDSVEDRLEFAD